MQKLLNMSGFFIKKSLNLHFFITKTLLFVFCLCFSLLTIINPVALKTTESFSCNKFSQAVFPSFQQIIKTLFHKQEKKYIL